MSKEKLPAYGGQALIEGVLMRGKKGLAAAFRTPNGEIEIRSEELMGIYKTNIRKYPFLRGLILLWDSLGLGMQYLTISANLQLDEDEEKLEGGSMFATIGISLLIGVGLFFLAPAGFGQFIENQLQWQPWAGNLVEGLVRLIMIILYIWGVGKMEDIERVFSYHGAEHKTINAYEDGAELIPEVVSKYSVEHPRCGTGFLLTLVIFSIILFSALGPLPLLWKLVSRVLLIPVLAGFAYEYMKWTADHLDNPIVSKLVRPNMLLQHLTTREPDLQMLEVSIAAFNNMLEMESSD
ncbi:MAG: DUF1385 domain-containing protein [Bacteroidales bacterium]|nr:DUF1385 domain-containing protein [Bacteroidales bacterium]